MGAMQNDAQNDKAQKAPIKLGFVIPVYNHGSTVGSVIRSLAVYGRPIIVVDDGNDAANKTQIREAVDSCPLAVLVEREKNGGKGKAMTSGILKAHELGLTHAFQIDSDAQHDASRASFFIEAAEENPSCLICGTPVFDESVPSSRKKGREISNRWARFVSLSDEIVDAMCGFRIYPISSYCRLLTHRACVDARMGYDADILVHFVWSGVHIKSYPVRVTYPADGISNFRMVRDNIRISLSFTKLFLGMIVRLPVLTFRAICRRRAYG
ncbi:glycosyltransferase family 2 protein [Treponema socranskii]|uniref:glycosyltransferase family 2 protein n=1 Tax=Treponema socranskii TaxID=53419 RepID=UPI003D8DBE8B